MTRRERVLRTFRFEPTDRVACDLMESVVWPELMDYFRRKYGLEDGYQVQDFLDTDFRWTYLDFTGTESPPPAEGLPWDWNKTYTSALYKRPLADATTVQEIEAWNNPNPDDWRPRDYKAARQRWPDHALVFSPGWMPLFCGACEAFGMEEAMMKMVCEPDLFEAFIRSRHGRYMAILRKGLPAARGVCDICWLGDDYAGNDGLLMRPELWRKFIKPYLAEQVRLIREHGLPVMIHSCGSVREILPDLIEIGISALLVFQTSAAGMDAGSIARDFGGKMVFYGGIDIQNLMVFGTPEDVRAAVRSNVEAFSSCGGYIVANCHHEIANIRGENIEAMFEAAREARCVIRDT